MKKQIALTVLALAALMGSAFADVTFIFNDNGAAGGTATSGSYAPGATITFDITLHYTAAGGPDNLAGFSAWFQSLQAGTPTGGIFTITGFSRTGSLFTDGQNAAFPDPMNNPTFADNHTDMGASLPSATAGQAPGDYLAGTISIQITGVVSNGQTYTIQNVFAPVGQPNAGHGSVAANKGGSSSVNIPSSVYTVTIIPEPATWSLIALGGLASVGFNAMRRRRQS